MYTNLYLVEELGRQRRQQFLEAAAQNRLSAQRPRKRWRITRHVFQVRKEAFNLRPFYGTIAVMGVTQGVLR